MSIRKRINRLLSPLHIEIRAFNIKEKNYWLKLYQQYPPESLTNKLFLNVGAGVFSHPYWTCVDKLTDHYSADIDLNSYHEWDLLLLKPIDYKSNSIEAIYTSHTLEHVTDEAANWFLKESHRILKQGGVCRVVLPDIRMAYNSYRRRDRDYFRPYSLPLPHTSTDPELPLHHVFMYIFASLLSPLSPITSHHSRLSEVEFDKMFDEYGMESTLDYFKQQIDITTQEQNPGHHINWYTHEKVISMLRNAGFENVNISGFGQSQCPVLRDTAYFDKQKLQQVSLYVEAIKS